MKHYKTVDIPAKTENRLMKTTCDMCGDEIDTASRFDIDEVDISWTHGTSYPECTNTETTRMDMCSSCFKEKLIPWLVSQGVELTESECDY